MSDKKNYKGLITQPEPRASSCQHTCAQGTGNQLGNSPGNSPGNQMDRRDFLGDALKKGFSFAVAMSVPSFLAGCTSENIEEIFQKHFTELGPKDLEKVIQRIEEKNKRRFGNGGTITTTPPMKGVVFGYGLDLSRCVGCRRCVYACVKENNQNRDPNVQWIRVLEFPKESGLDFAEANPYYCAEESLRDEDNTAPRLTEHQKEILKKPEMQYPLYNVDQNKKDANRDPGCEVPRQGHFYAPVACQQCDNPPCTRVCPVKATWKEPDGIVVIDYNWCIGCRYCMAACPYGARHFNWTEPKIPTEEINPHQHYLGNRPRMRGVVEKCTFCIQRTREGRYPACVEICPVGARKFGNLLDPNSEIRYIMEHKRVLILKNDLNTHPKFYYFYGT